MKKYFICLLVCLVLQSAHSAPQSDDDLDYSVPGEATEDCLCVPFYQCQEGEIVTDGSNIIDPRKKVQEEELGLVSVSNIYNMTSDMLMNACQKNKLNTETFMHQSDT